MAHQQRGGQNELIFVNNPRSGPRETVVVEEVQGGEHVDLEIIILGPKRRGRRPTDAKKRNKLRNFKKNNRSSSKPAKSDSDSDEAYEDTEATANNPTNTTDQAKKVKQGGQKSPSPKSSPKVDESLLKRLESRYGQKRLVADDDTYVDYMDYF